MNSFKQKFIDSISVYSYSDHDLAVSVRDFYKSRSEDTRNIVSILNKVYSENLTYSQALDLLSENGLDHSKIGLATSDGQIYKMDSLLAATISARSNDSVTITSWQGQQKDFAVCIDELAQANAASMVYQSALDALAMSDENSSSQEMVNNFANILNTNVDVNSDVVRSNSSYYLEVLERDDFSIRDKLSAVMQRLSNVQLKRSGSTSIHFETTDGVEYTGVSPLVAWIGGIDIDFSNFNRFFETTMESLSKIIWSIGGFVSSLITNVTNWIVATFITGSNFKTRSIWKIPFVDIPAFTRKMTIHNTLYSPSRVTPFIGDNHLCEEIYQALGCTLEQGKQAILSVIPQDKFLLINMKFAKLYVYRDDSFVYYQMFISPTNPNTSLGKSKFITWSGSASSGYTSNISVENYFNSLFESDFMDYEINSDSDACASLQMTWMRINLICFFLAATDTFFNPEMAKDLITGTSWSPSYDYIWGVDSMMQCIGADSTDGQGHYFCGCSYNASEMSNFNLFGTVFPYPNNSQLIQYVTENLNMETVLYDRLLGVLLKYVVLNNSSICLKYNYTQQDIPYLPYTTVYKVDTRCRFTIATDADNKKSFSNFLKISTAAVTLVAAAVGYWKLRGYMIGVLTKAEANYWSSINALGRAEIDSQAYNTALSNTIYYRRKLYWTSKFASLVGVAGTSAVSVGSTGSSNAISSAKNASSIYSAIGSSDSIISGISSAVNGMSDTVSDIDSKQDSSIEMLNTISNKIS